MTNVSFIREDSRKKGAKRTIKLAAIAAGATKQYTKTDDKLKGLIRQFGYFNQITVLNNGAVDIEIALDFADNKCYPVPAASNIALDEIMYQEFNIVNLDAANATVINKITVICAHESPLLREKMKTKKEMYRRGF